MRILFPVDEVVGLTTLPEERVYWKSLNSVVSFHTYCLRELPSPPAIAAPESPPMSPVNKKLYRFTDAILIKISCLHKRYRHLFHHPILLQI